MFYFQDCWSACQQLDALKAFVLFEVENLAHEIVSVDFGKRQWKREAFAGRELAGGAVAGLVAPEIHKSIDAPCSAAKPGYFFPAAIDAGQPFREQLGLIDEPIDEKPGFFIAEPAGEQFVV